MDALQFSTKISISASANTRINHGKHTKANEINQINRTRVVHMSIFENVIRTLFMSAHV